MEKCNKFYQKYTLVQTYIAIKNKNNLIVSVYF